MMFEMKISVKVYILPCISIVAVPSKDLYSQNKKFSNVGSLADTLALCHRPFPLSLLSIIHRLWLLFP